MRRYAASTNSLNKLRERFICHKETYSALSRNIKDVTSLDLKWVVTCHAASWTLITVRYFEVLLVGQSSSLNHRWLWFINNEWCPRRVEKRNICASNRNCYMTSGNFSLLKHGVDINSVMWSSNIYKIHFVRIEVLTAFAMDTIFFLKYNAV
jgi:hypothetical protein